MRKINENDYVSFTINIARNGCNLTLNTLKSALREYGNITAGTLYDNKADGTRAIIDSK